MVRSVEDRTILDAMGPKAGVPEPAPPDRPHGSFVRGSASPRGIVWYGFRSFWGHLQHFVASAIATEDIDSRDWMQADEPITLAREIAAVISDAPAKGESLVEQLDQDLVVDYVADTGDDVSVSEAVANLVFARWEVPDPERPGETLVLPRGDVLCFGGDTAYPVATAAEIHARVAVPFNKAIAKVKELDPPGKRRVLVGIPGNHDWYDGLDGFARMFRRRLGELAPARDVDAPAERETRLEHVVQFVEKFVVGGHIEKQKTLALDGYVPVQQASYFALPLAPGIDLLAADRQLRRVDFRQRRFFADFREHRRQHLVVLLPDPVYAFQEPSVTGVESARALELDLKNVNHLVLSGDVHHYERLQVDASLHVTAGGGGAFLHPARLGGEHLPKPEAQFPGPIATRSLLFGVPLRVMIGRAGFIPHVVMLTLFAPALEIGVRLVGDADQASIVAGVFSAIVLALLADIRRRTRQQAIRVAILAAIAGAIIGFVPTLASVPFTMRHVHIGPYADMALMLLVATFVGAFVFGAYLSALTALGVENTQAFTCLGHPGYKHFLRMRIRRDGSAIDGFVFGLVDPLAPGEKPVLVDTWTWRPKG